MKICRNKFSLILLVGKETATLVGNSTVPLNIAPQLHKRLVHTGIFISALFATTQKVDGGKQIHAMKYNSALTKVVPAAGKKWRGIPNEQHT